jgi:hypothetical protein
MKIITIQLSDEYIQYIERIYGVNCPNQEELGRKRFSIRKFVLNEIFILDNLRSNIKIEKRNCELYELCIFCGRILYKPKKPYKYKNCNITELRKRKNREKIKKKF